MTPAPETKPVAIEYKRWRHKNRGYLVEVFQVQNFLGKHGYLTMVTVERRGMAKRMTWPANTFLKLFEPYGRRMRRKSRYDLLMEE